MKELRYAHARVLTSPVRAASSTPPLQRALRPVEVVAFVAEVGHPYVDDPRGGRQLEAPLCQQPQRTPERFVRFPQAALLCPHPGMYHHAREPRFTATISDGGNTIAGRWEKAPDGRTWETDLDLTYRKVR